MIDLKGELDALDGMRRQIFKVFPSYIFHIRFPRYKNMSPNTRIDFPFPITALVGSNGSGKTSILNALYGAPIRYSTGEFWFSTEVDPIEEGEGSPNRFIYGHYNSAIKTIVETRKARVRKVTRGRANPNYWEPTKEAPGDQMQAPALPAGRKIDGRSSDRWNPVKREILYINFRKELSAFDKYFYFGKDPALDVQRKNAAAKRAGKGEPAHRILSKTDRIRLDAVLLAKVIETEDTSQMRYNRKVALENRLLTKDELAFVSFILGRKYVEARWIRHRLFQGDGNLSIVFRTEHGRYSEAFAGSGEVAVTSCVVQVLGTREGTLVLLDEPEVSLHPGAQERLLAFLAKFAKQRKLQIIFSTHSPHLIASLPDDAIKTFYDMPGGVFGVIPSTHPYAAFRRLGDTRGLRIQVIVEDRLAKIVVEQAITLITDAATRDLFEVEFVQGGAGSILNNRIPVLMESKQKVLVLLDGDQKKVEKIRDPNTVPPSDDVNLERIVLDEVGASPVPLIDGSTRGGNKEQKSKFFRDYLIWARENLRYIPLSCPEELVLVAVGEQGSPTPLSSEVHKSRLHSLASENRGRRASSDETDSFGGFLLGQHRSESVELKEIVAVLENFLKSIRLAHSSH